MERLSFALLLLFTGGVTGCGRQPMVATKPNPEQIQQAFTRCVSEDVIHLLTIGMAGARDPSYAEAAKTAAKACGATRGELQRINAPASCVASAGQFEVFLWKLANVLDGRNSPEELAFMQMPDVNQCSSDAGMAG